MAFTFIAPHAQIYHGSKTVNPIRKNSAILPNIRVPWKSLAEKLTKSLKNSLLLQLKKYVCNRSKKCQFSRCKQVRFRTLKTFSTFLSYTTCTRVTKKEICQVAKKSLQENLYETIFHSSGFVAKALSYLKEPFTI